MTGNTAELFECIDKAMAALKSDHRLQEISFDHDYYWDIDIETAINIADGDPTLQVGRLMDDLEAIRRIESGEYPINSVELNAIASVLRYISRIV